MSIIKEIYELNDYHLAREQFTPKDFIAGAELEIECVRDFSNSRLNEKGIVAEQDGSLRNGGREFLLPPSKKDKLVELFQYTHKHLTLGEDPFSQRTSTHVHVNCMWSTEQQVRDLLYLYAIFEPIFFAYVGPERRENIHCMPLGSTHMPNHYKLRASHIQQRWHKYTALNLLPLNSLGTVEFRHLYGTGDHNVFSQWLGMLEILWTTAHEWGGFTQKDLTNLDRLRAVETKLLSLDYHALAKEHPQFVLEDNLLDVKLAFV